ncbi:exonuclease [Actinomadura sp. B10D3]|uniref:exonuclease n=1 Tax=Actinomadura sp. B10D3 TaxID=3153557 RepID=UPI00325C8071
MARTEAYFSVDIEADGPIPGPYSMLSFGIAACGTFDGATFEPSDPSKRTFYAELKPISDDFVPEALAVSGLDREKLAAEGRRPEEAMHAASGWIERTAGDATPVLVAYPLAFDWMWLYWYWIRFTSSSPFGHSRHLDIKSLYAAKANAMVVRSTKRQMPAALLPDRPHTHNALDDAVEQAELFQNLVRWDG